MRLFRILLCALLSSGVAFGADLPAWVNSTASHTWSPQLGGGVWYQQQAVLDAVAPVLVSEWTRPVLVGLRSRRTQEDYRFDLDTWDANASEYAWWEDRASAENVIQTFEAEGTTDFMWSIPSPDPANLLADPEATTGAGFRHQQAAYYAAYLQYLIEDVTMTAGEYGALDLTYDFFTDASCDTVNTTSETAVEGNWANLRAKRGHPDPYPLDFVIIGVEPYGNAQETLAGTEYSTIAEDYKVKIRARGGALTTVPLGIHSTNAGGNPYKAGSWFRSVLAGALTSADFSYIDTHHYYRSGSPADLMNRIFPLMTNTDTVLTSPDYDYYWIAQGSWPSDYSAYLYNYEDTLSTLDDVGETSSRWILGNSEHGLAIVSQQDGNDFGAAIHWALWLAEVARYNGAWDAPWVLAEQHFSHALIHLAEANVTRTPGYYVYQMAQEFYGFQYLPVHTLTNNQWVPDYSSPSAQTGTIPGDVGAGETYSSDDTAVRVFREGGVGGNIHLFVINKHPTNSTSLTGFEAWTFVAWDQLSTAVLTDENPVGDHLTYGCGQAGGAHVAGQAWHSEWITTQDVSGSHSQGDAFSVPALSINHIEISASAVYGDPGVMRRGHLGDIVLP